MICTHERIRCLNPQETNIVSAFAFSLLVLIFISIETARIVDVQKKKNIPCFVSTNNFLFHAIPAMVQKKNRRAVGQQHHKQTIVPVSATNITQNNSRYPKECTNNGETLKQTNNNLKHAHNIFAPKNRLRWDVLDWFCTCCCSLL